MLICAQYIFPITAHPIVNGAILVQDGEIKDIDTAEMLRLRYPDEEVNDFGLAAVMPGFVDVYACLDRSVLRGVVKDVPYASWLLAIADKSSELEASDWYDSAVLGGLDALSAGITTVGDITATGAACSAVQKLGLRGVIYREVGAMDKMRVDYAMDSAESDIMQWREEVDSDRVTVGIAPTAVYACHPLVFGRVSQCATENKLPVAMRLAGSHEEFNFVKYGSSMFSVHVMDDSQRGYVEIPPWMPTGESPVRYALNWGAFESPNVMVIHAVHVDDEDIQKLRDNNVSIGTCARANAQMGMGVAPLGAFLRAGLNVGLGTDSPAATEAIDMFSEMRVGMLIHRAFDRRRFFDATTMLELATIGGAQALGLGDKIGSLEIGKCADLVAVDLSGSHEPPEANPVSAVVNTCSASDVLMTMVGGKVLYEKDRWNVDVEVTRNIARVIDIRAKLKV